jgi:hypothetical protein
MDGQIHSLERRDTALAEVIDLSDLAQLYQQRRTIPAHESILSCVDGV